MVVVIDGTGEENEPTRALRTAAEWLIVRRPDLLDEWVDDLHVARWNPDGTDWTVIDRVREIHTPILMAAMLVAGEN